MCGLGRSVLWGWDADGLGSAGFDGAAGDGLGGFVQADFDGGEVVVAAAEGEAGGGVGGVGGLEEADDLVGWHGDLVVELGEDGGDGDGWKAVRARVKKASGVRPEQVPWVCHSWRRRPGSG